MKEVSDKRRPVIAWLILVYDGTAGERFPLKRKWYRFNYEKATDEEAFAVLRLLKWDERDERRQGPELKLGQARVTVSLSVGEPFTRRQILRYRHLFEPVAEENVASKEEALRGFVNVTLPPDDYFEDENEQAISMVEMRDREARRVGGEHAFAIVAGHPESVLRLGPTAPVLKELWSAKDADLLAQFFSTYWFLIRSRWFVTRCEVSPSRGGTGTAVLPVTEDCMSIILPFRQIYSSDGMDDLFNRSCGIHNRHCPKETPHHSWVEHYKKAFNSYLNRTATPLMVKASISTRRYLDAFAYGAGIVHATSKTDEPRADLEALLGNNQKELVVLGYHSILHFLLGYVSQAVPIIQQNAHHWTHGLGWAGSARLAAQDLFDPSRDVDAR